MRGDENRRPTRSILLRRMLLSTTCLAVTCVATVSVLAPVALALLVSHRGAAAHARRVISINETTKLRLIGRPGHVLNERGPISGTYNGVCTARLVTITNRTGRATVTVVTSRGTLRARAMTRARKPRGAIASFTGEASVIGGTGRWAHASGHLTFDGTVDRQNFHATAQIRGKLRF
jgi:hypothetical protein